MKNKYQILSDCATFDLKVTGASQTPAHLRMGHTSNSLNNSNGPQEQRTYITVTDDKLVDKVSQQKA